MVQIPGALATGLPERGRSLVDILFRRVDVDTEARAQTGIDDPHTEVDRPAQDIVGPRVRAPVVWQTLLSKAQ